jgi:signal transduction histidine kinase
MCAAACFVFAIVHMMLWLRGSYKPDYLIIAVMATAAGCNVILEMLLLLTTDVDQYIFTMKLDVIAIFLVLMSLLWFIRVYLQAGSRWLLGVIVLLWTITLVSNFFSPGGVVFSEITAIGRSEAFWGESFSHPIGIVHPLKIWSDIASLLILIFLAQATWHSWHRDRHNRAIVVGGSSILFILLAGVHTPLVDMGLIRMPYMIGFAFLAIVAALTYQLLSEWLKTQSDLLQTRRDLERIARAVVLGEVAAGLAHELNQPLSAVLSNAQAGRRILAKKNPDLVEIGEIFEDIIVDDKRAGDIVHGLRAMMREETDESAAVDIDSAIHLVTSILGGEFSVHDVTVTTDLASNIPLVRGDSVQIQQVIMNLLMNAVHALDASPRSKRRIRLSAAASDDGVRVSVLDHGPGIDEQLREQLFSPFVPSQRGGLGLGLAICRRIVERNSGQIWVERTDSSGTEVCFTLPRANGNRHA